MADEEVRTYPVDAVNRVKRRHDRGAYDHATLHALLDAALCNMSYVVDGQPECRADVVGIFYNEASIRRLVGAIQLEQNDEWQLQHRHMTLETMAGRGDEPTTALLKAA